MSVPPPDVTSPDLEPLIELSNSVRAWIAGASPYDGNDPVLAASTAPAYLAQVGMVAPLVGTTGWKQREQQLNQGPGQANRVLFIPGTFPDGADQGRMLPPVRRKGPYYRVLATFRRIVTVSIWAVDNAAPGNLDNEELQIVAIGRLRSLVFAALHSVALGDFRREGPVKRDPSTSKNMSFGIEELYQFEHDEEQLDLPTNTSGTPVTPVES